LHRVGRTDRAASPEDIAHRSERSWTWPTSSSTALIRPSTLANNGGVRTDAAIAQSQIAAVYPGLSWNGKATQSLPHKGPFFSASYSFYRTGQYSSFGGYERARQGGVLFCGEHTSVDFQRFMEGAASEGQRAAKQLVGLLGMD
jgi:monoamine oxidase